MRTKAGLIVALVLALVVTGRPQWVSAHAGYERSSPAAESVIPAAPEQLDIWFTQELFRRARVNTITVTGADGQRVDNGEAMIDSADRKRLSVQLVPGIPAGVYTVGWTSLSATDGDTAEGSFTFTVDPNTSPSSGGVKSTPAPASTSADTQTSPVDTSDDAPAAGQLTDEAGSFPWWVLVVGAAIGLSGAIVAWTLLRTGL